MAAPDFTHLCPAEKLSDMKAEMRQLFPYFLDTKLLCQDAALAGKIENTNLEALYEQTAESTFSAPSVAFLPGFEKYGLGTAGNPYHEVLMFL